MDETVIYRLGFGMSRRQARQLIRHGHVAVNGRKVNIPSYEVTAGEEIAIRENSKKLTVLELAKEFSSHGTMPSWLEVDRAAGRIADDVVGRSPVDDGLGAVDLDIGRAGARGDRASPAAERARGLEAAAGTGDLRGGRRPSNRQRRRERNRLAARALQPHALPR